ncbi:MAG: transposase [bacterium]|nr:transposase [bacterium]
MVKGNSSRLLGVEVGESGVVSHVGLWALGRFADRLGLGAALSEAFGEAKVVHDRGSVLVHAMLMLAGGGEACTDVEHLRAEPDLFGEVASDSTLPRTMRSIDTNVLDRLGGAVTRVRNRVWGRLVNTDGPVVSDIDSSLHEVHSENKEGTAPTYKRGFGFHPMYCTLDATGEALSVLLRPGNAAANNVSDHTDVLDAAVKALPERVAVGHRRGDDRDLVVQPLRVRCDSAGGRSFANACRERNMMTTKAVSWFRLDRTMSRPTAAVAPVFCRPAPRTNMQATVRTAGLLKHVPFRCIPAPRRSICS